MTSVAFLKCEVEAMVGQRFISIQLFYFVRCFLLILEDLKSAYSHSQLKEYAI